METVAPVVGSGAGRGFDLPGWESRNSARKAAATKGRPSGLSHAACQSLGVYKQEGVGCKDDFLLVKMDLAKFLSQIPKGIDLGGLAWDSRGFGECVRWPATVGP